MKSIWIRKDKYNIHLDKDYATGILVKLYVKDDRWRFSIIGKINTKYEKYRLESTMLKNVGRHYGWSSLSSAKKKALECLRYFILQINEDGEEIEKENK